MFTYQELTEEIMNLRERFKVASKHEKPILRHEIKRLLLEREELNALYEVR